MSRLYTIKQTAQILGVKPNWLYAQLRALHLTTKANLPVDRMIANGCMQIQLTPYLDNKGRERYSHKTVLSQKGVGYLDQTLRAKFPALERLRAQPINDNQTTNSRKAV